MGAKGVGLKAVKLCKRAFQCVCMASGCVCMCVVGKFVGGGRGEICCDLAS